LISGEEDELLEVSGEEEAELDEEEDEELLDFIDFFPFFGI